MKLAKCVWAVAKKEDMCHDDLVSCCSLLIANVAEKTGEDVEYLISEVRRRLKPNDGAQARARKESE